MLIKRGDVFYADLDPIIDSEQGGVRPVLVVQNNVGNKYSPLYSAVRSEYLQCVCAEPHQTQISV